MLANKTQTQFAARVIRRSSAYARGNGHFEPSLAGGYTQP
jgi:hypothetical protein